jgi:hypothetical protein
MQMLQSTAADSSETTAWLDIWTEFLVVSLQDMSLIKSGN